MKYSLPNRMHVTNLMRALEIIDHETSFLMEKFTTVKLLHIHNSCKTMLYSIKTKKNLS